MCTTHRCTSRSDDCRVPCFISSISRGEFFSRNPRRVRIVVASCTRPILLDDRAYVFTCQRSMRARTLKYSSKGILIVQRRQGRHFRRRAQLRSSIFYPLALRFPTVRRIASFVFFQFLFRPWTHRERSTFRASVSSLYKVCTNWHSI